MNSLVLMVVGGIVLFSSVALAQNATQADSRRDSAATPSEADVSFMKALAAGDLAEVDAELASRKAHDTGIQHFGEHVVKDHSKNESELKALAKKMSVDLPDSVDRSMRRPRQGWRAKLVRPLMRSISKVRSGITRRPCNSCKMRFSTATIRPYANLQSTHCPWSITTCRWSRSWRRRRLSPWPLAVPIKLTAASRRRLRGLHGPCGRRGAKDRGFTAQAHQPLAGTCQRSRGRS
jgi:hypothetical protein